VGRSRLGLLAVIISLVALAGLAGCDAGRPPAAKIGQIEISSDTLISDLDAEAARAKATGSESTPVRDVEDTYSATAAAELLGRRIRYELLGAVLRARKITVTQQERDTAEQTLCSGQQQQQQQQQQQPGCPGLKGYPEAYRQFQIDLTARGNAYQADISQAGATDAAAKKRYDTLKASGSDELEVRCYVGATITDPASVETIQLRVAGGSTFADAIASVDGAEVAGAKQCDPVSLIPDEVGGAKSGAVLGPYTNQQGSQFIVQIQERRTGTYDELAALLKQDLAQKQQQNAVEELLSKAKVSVDPRYGRWDRATGSVVAPEGPSPATTDSTPAPA
jgi:hypothetical protein